MVEENMLVLIFSVKIKLARIIGGLHFKKINAKQSAITPKLTHLNVNSEYVLRSYVRFVRKIILSFTSTDYGIIYKNIVVFL